ncbi:unnamed protein product, partial [Prunus brigantina]
QSQVRSTIIIVVVPNFQVPHFHPLSLSLFCNSEADLSLRIRRKLESFLIHFYKKYLEESCQPKCVKPLIEYQACVKRVEADNNGEKHCTGQYFDYISCVDKCVAPKLFGALK